MGKYISQPQDETNIFLVRHGQTEWNLQSRLQGQQNSPLTEVGREQAVKTRDSLAHQEIHKAYVSPLQRALDTMAIILGGRTVEVVRSDNLKEISLGPWEGKTRMEAEQAHPDAYDRFWNNPDQFVLPGAETFRHLQSRVVGELDTIFRREKGRNMLVVSHWIAIKVAIAHYASTPLYQLSSIPDPINGSFLTLSLRDSKISLV